MLPHPIKKFADLFATLPSLGPRQATRLAFYLASRGKAEIAEFARALAALDQLQICKECFAHYENTPKLQKNTETTRLCEICSDPHREHNIIALVERETDRFSIEKSKKFRGRYLVIGEIARDGTLNTEQKLRLAHFKRLITERFGKAKEIILALNSTTLADLEADILLSELKTVTERITRLGRGMPTGGEIEFADEDTLGGALENRK